jgi:hypothetical protein
MLKVLFILPPEVKKDGMWTLESKQQELEKQKERKEKASQARLWDFVA